VFRTDPDLNHVVTEKIKCSPSGDWNFVTMYAYLYLTIYEMACIEIP